MSEATETLNAARALVEAVQRGSENKLAETLAPLATAVLEEIHEQRVSREAAAHRETSKWTDPRAQTIMLADQFARLCRDLGLDPKDPKAWSKVRELAELMKKE